MRNAQVVRNTASMPKSWLTEAPESMANALASMDSDSVIDLDNVHVDDVGNPCMDSMGCTDQGCNKKEAPVTAEEKVETLLKEPLVKIELSRESMLLECHPQTVSRAFRGSSYSIFARPSSTVATRESETQDQLHLARLTRLTFRAWVKTAGLSH